MKQEKIATAYLANWWLWNGKTFEQHELEVEAVEIAKCGKYRFFRAKNPVKRVVSHRKWLVAEGGTGYVLAYGATEQEALHAARARFCGDWKISPADVTQYIHAHLALLQLYVGKHPEFVLPAPGKGITPIAINGSEGLWLTK
ncbi:MAG: hypothetical protein H6569_07395 [Lewinellaceae bacterium]|nr:hypothetical protein [Lewinellaceae bacterium]MCB9315945.1 hypothetical protein [Lewinellaceae bacterium]